LGALKYTIYSTYINASAEIEFRMVKDPVCGMVVDDKTAIKADIEGRQFYFCSSNCMKTFANPEKELSKLKKRMYVAATGALILAIIRGALYFGLAFGAVAITWAPIPNIPYLTWGLVAFHYSYTSPVHWRMDFLCRCV
jgi:Cu+-exporting ATPase